MKKSSLDLTEIKLRALIDHERDYEFPEFLILLRKALKQTKQVICYDLEWDYDILFRLESGSLRKHDPEKIRQLAEYYGVPSHILSDKWKKWIHKRKFQVPK